MNRRWSDNECELLRKFYPEVNGQISRKEISKLLNRDFTAIEKKAWKLGLRLKKQEENINMEMLKDLENRIDI